mmetsp:Transcript_26080/g.62054  ORF Transcript_26080/g.62054 Transcript_26080/m.62054 type:complete len:217 (+) Transcript_26080:113-763(+)
MTATAAPSASPRGLLSEGRAAEQGRPVLPERPEGTPQHHTPHAPRAALPDAPQMRLGHAIRAERPKRKRDGSLHRATPPRAPALTRHSPPLSRCSARRCLFKLRRSSRRSAALRAKLRAERKCAAIAELSSPSSNLPAVSPPSSSASGSGSAPLGRRRSRRLASGALGAGRNAPPRVENASATSAGPLAPPIAGGRPASLDDPIDATPSAVDATSG